MRSYTDHYVCTQSRPYIASHSSLACQCLSGGVHLLQLEDSHISARARRSEPRLPNFIEVLPGAMDAKVGEAVVIECSVAGDPTPSVTWYRDKIPIIPRPNVQMCYDGESATLKLLNFKPSDTGRYTCTAKNMAGEARTSTRVSIKGKIFVIKFALKCDYHQKPLILTSSSSIATVV